MDKTPKQVTEDILNALRRPNAPEGIIMEPYLQKWEQSIKKKILEQVYHEIDSECISETDQVRMQTISDIFVNHGADSKKME